MKNKKFLVTLIVLVLLFGVSCNEHEDEYEHIHVSSGSAGCTQDEVCVECGEVLTKAIGHKPLTEASCEEPCVCSVCGETLEQPTGHKNVLRDCEEGEVCSVCGKSLSEPQSHVTGPQGPCTESIYCTVCNKLLSEGKSHTSPETFVCTEGKKCTVCGETIEAPISHTPDREKADCLHEVICTVCGTVLEEKTDHTPGQAATQSSAQYCLVCGKVLASPLVDDTFIEETVNSGHYIDSITPYYSGNVLICGNYAMEYFTPSESGNAKYADAVNAFASKYPELVISCMIVPKSASFTVPKGYKDKSDRHKSFIESTYAMLEDSIITPDAFGAMFEHRGEYLFYRTDHHWTSLGAYYAFEAYCQSNGIVPRALDSYERVINSGYMGSLYSFSASPKPETLCRDYSVARLPVANYTMSYTTDGVTKIGKAINTASKTYAGMFMCGDQAFTDIVTDNNTGRKLIVFKESYGNAIVPYFIDVYDEIIVVDVRYDTESVASIIEKYGITDALIINNIQAAAGGIYKNLQKKLVS